MSCSKRRSRRQDRPNLEQVPEFPKPDAPMAKGFVNVRADDPAVHPVREPSPGHARDPDRLIRPR
jgi:hypothetical protein